MKKYNLAFIDIETTGLSFCRHEIIEIGCVLAQQDPLEIIEEFDIKIHPEKPSQADPVALRINGYKESDWVNAVSLKEALKFFADKTEKAIAVAHNISFDFAFLNKAFEDTGVSNKMSYHKLDTISIAFAKLNNNENVEKYSLEALCKYFGIENKKAHTALSDAKATCELYKKLIES